MTSIYWYSSIDFYFRRNFESTLLQVIQILLYSPFFPDKNTVAKYQGIMVAYKHQAKYQEISRGKTWDAAVRLQPG